MKRKVLVTGAFGQLGMEVLYALQDQYDLLAVDLNIIGSVKFNGRSAQLDITSEASLKKIFGNWLPDIIVNLAAVTNVDLCERRPDLATAVNATAITSLLEAANTPDLHFIQISTDYLFDGEAGPYGEDDLQNPINRYGKSKQAGEENLIAGTDNFTILRTNVVFGGSTHTGASFLKWLIDSLRANRQVNIVVDQWNNPTWTVGLAEALKAVIDRNITGIFNYAGSDYLTRLDFAREIASVYGLDQNLIDPIKTAELNQIAPRPLQGGLKTEKISTVSGINLYSIDQAVTTIYNQGSI